MTTRRKIRILRRARKVVQKYTHDNWNALGTEGLRKLSDIYDEINVIIKKLEDESNIKNQ